MIKLKRKLSYHGHAYFEAVSPEVVTSALNYLKENNHLYSDIVIDVGQIPSNLLSLTEPVGTTFDHESIVDDVAPSLEEIENPLDTHRLTLIREITHV